MVVVGALAVTGAVGLVVAEVAGRRALESEVTGRLADAGIVGEVDVVVGKAWWRPTIVPAVLTGDLDRVTVHVDGGELGGLPVTSAHYVLDDLGGDLSLRNRSVEVETLGRGEVRLVVNPDVIGRLTGTELSVVDGRLVGPSGEAVTATLDGDVLVLSGEGIPDGDAAPSVTVVDPYLLPCRPDLTVDAAGLELACTGDDLPGVLRAPLAGTGDLPPTSDAVEDLPPPQTLVRPGG